MNLYDEISKVAYEIWLKKGMPAGNDMENWLEAEQIVYASLRQKNDPTIKDVTYSVATIASVSKEVPEKDILNPDSSSASESDVVPIVKKKRGPYKKRKASTEKKTRATKDKATEKKGTRGRKKKTE